MDGQIGYLIDTNIDTSSSGPNREEASAAQNFFLEIAETVEASGFGAIFLPDRHMRRESVGGNQLALLAAIAARTTTIRVGTYSTVLTLYNPMLVAETIAQIDLLSRGRVIFSPTMGFHADYWRFYGIDPGQRYRRFVEAMDVVLKAWTENEPWSYNGQVFNFENVFLSPRPYRQPHPTLWLGGQSENAIRRAGKWGEAYAAGPFPLDRETWLRQVALYKDEAQRNGIADPKVVLLRHGFIADTQREADEVLERLHIPEAAFYLEQGLLTHHPGIRSRADLTLENLSAHAVCGPPERCQEALDRFRHEYEADYVIIKLWRDPRRPLSAQLEDIRRFGAEVIGNQVESSGG